MYDQLSNDGSQFGIKEAIMEGEGRIRHQQRFSRLLDDHEMKLSWARKLQCWNESKVKNIQTFVQIRLLLSIFAGITQRHICAKA